MERKRSFIYIVLSILSYFLLIVAANRLFAQGNPISDDTPGSLAALDKTGKPLGSCPLVHTEVKAEISGVLSRTTVRQEFHNSFRKPIEAVYAFPLPHNAAIDDMTIHTGARTIRGIVRRREEAKAIYEQAKAQGRLAGLLDQERPNIFTQHLANILPGQGIDIVISYVETLKYSKGGYRYLFPTVVGPRYIPGRPVGKQGGGWAPDTNRVSDASRITPRVTPPGTRSGHDISIEVRIDSGVPFTNLRCESHEISIPMRSTHTALVQLAGRDAIPNKDFILSYDVAGSQLQDGLVTHRMDGEGYFMLILQPPRIFKQEQVVPKELIFVLDTSGSMQGFPIEKAKETMNMALNELYPHDTFNLIAFSGYTKILFPQPVPATREHLQLARRMLSESHGSGGTEMIRAIRAALAPSDEQGHVRIVCFMTDGFVGNDMEIISEVQKHPNARVFSFGIGSAPNRFLLDKIAEEGRGAAEYLTLEGDAADASARFHDRIRNPLLTDITLEWSGTPVYDLYPRRIPDLFSAEPIVICGRYERGGSALLRLRGTSGMNSFHRDIRIPLPERESHHAVLAKLWARSRIDALMAEDFAGVQRGDIRPELKEAIARLGLDHRLMTQFTSFVAVEERIANEGGKPITIQVPVEMPEGVSYEGVFGVQAARSALLPMMAGKGGGIGSGHGTGIAGGVAGGVSASVSGGLLSAGVAPPAPSPPPRPVKREPIKIGGNIRESLLIRKVIPEYPELAKRARIEDSVLLLATVDEEGNVALINVQKGHPLLNQAAIDAVKQWKYTPTVLNGQPVPITGTVVVQFSLDPSRMDSAVSRVVARIKAGQPAGPEKFIKEGKAELELVLSSRTDAVKGRLLSIGFEIISWPDGAGAVIGRMPAEKLERLLEIDAVSKIAPHFR